VDEQRIRESISSTEWLCGYYEESEEDPVGGIIHCHDEYPYVFILLKQCMSHTYNRIPYLKEYILDMMYRFAVLPMISGIPKGLHDDEVSTFMWMYVHDNGKYEDNVLHHYTLEEARNMIRQYGVNISRDSMLRMVAMTALLIRGYDDGDMSAMEDIVPLYHLPLFMFNYGEDDFTKDDIREFSNDTKKMPSDLYPLFPLRIMKGVHYADTYYDNRYDVMNSVILMLLDTNIYPEKRMSISMNDYQWLSSIDFSTRPYDDEGYAAFVDIRRIGRNKVLLNVMKRHDDMGLLAMIYALKLIKELHKNGYLSIPSSMEHTYMEAVMCFFKGIDRGNPWEFEFEVLLSKIA
jgi:hypothetical protein